MLFAFVSNTCCFWSYMQTLRLLFSVEFNSIHAIISYFPRNLLRLISVTFVRPRVSCREDMCQKYLPKSIWDNAHGLIKIWTRMNYVRGMHITDHFKNGANTSSRTNYFFDSYNSARDNGERITSQRYDVCTVRTRAPVRSTTSGNVPTEWFVERTVRLDAEWNLWILTTVPDQQRRLRNSR